MARIHAQLRPASGMFRCQSCGQTFASHDELLEHEVECRPGSGRGSQIPRPVREWREHPEQTL